MVKVLDKKYLNSLLDGKLYMKAVAAFCDLSNRDENANNDFRGDVLEGICESFADGHNPHAYIETRKGIKEIISGQAGLIDVLALREKIYCMYALEYSTDKGEMVKPDKRMLQFGNTSVVIYNVKAFLYRVCNAMITRFDDDFWSSFKRVEYDVNLEKQQYYDIFHKSESYNWQQEFRIAIDLANGKFDRKTLDNITDFALLTFPGIIKEDTNPDSIADELFLDIGCIRDICIVVPTEELINDGIRKKIPQEYYPPDSVPEMVLPHPVYPTFFKMVARLP